MANGRRKDGQGRTTGRVRHTATRMAVYHRDGFACVYCAAAADDGVTLTLDHVLAHELGGTNDPTNLLTACLSCNSAKRHLTMRAWFRLLRDRGVDTSGVAARVRRQVARKLDRAEGRRLAALRGED